MLVNNNSHMTTPNPEPSQPHPLLCMELRPEPTGDTEPEPAVMNKLETKTELTITPEPDVKSDQVREPATPSVPVGMLVEYEGKRKIPLILHKSKSSASLLVPPSSKSPVPQVIPPSFPLPPLLPITASSLATPLLFPFSPPAPCLTPLCCLDLHRVFQSPAPACRSPGSTSSCRDRLSTLAPPSLGST